MNIEIPELELLENCGCYSWLGVPYKSEKAFWKNCGECKGTGIRVTDDGKKVVDLLKHVYPHLFKKSDLEPTAP